jgi:hypothetical protein
MGKDLVKLRKSGRRVSGEPLARKIPARSDLGAQFVRVAPPRALPHSRSWAGQPMSITDVSAAMRVRVSDPALLGDLQRYLRAAECEVEQAGDDALDVSIPRAPSDEQARREVAIYIQAWRAMNPGARAEIVA